jgi:hypothetical protein
LGESVDAAPLFAPFAFAFPALELVDGVVPPCAAHVAVMSLVGERPADAFAPKQADPDGVPAAPLPSALFAEKSSDAEDGPVPHCVPMLTSVGTPGAASAVEHVDALVGSSAEPIPASDPANEPLPVATATTRTLESEVETLVWLASASAAGPDVVVAGTDPSGVDGSGCDADAVVGTLAVVPGPLADVEPLAGAFGPAVLELDAVIGSLDSNVAGPASPPLAEADPPAVEPCGSGWMFGCADNAGPSASAGPAQIHRSAMTAMSSSSFLIS